MKWACGRGRSQRCFDRPPATSLDKCSWFPTHHRNPRRKPCNSVDSPTSDPGCMDTKRTSEITPIAEDQTLHHLTSLLSNVPKTSSHAGRRKSKRNINPLQVGSYTPSCTFRKPQPSSQYTGFHPKTSNYSESHLGKVSTFLHAQSMPFWELYMYIYMWSCRKQSRSPKYGTSREDMYFSGMHSISWACSMAFHMHSPLP